MNERRVEYLFQLWNRELLLVTAGSWYDTWRLHIGPEGEPMERIDVSHADRARDGGTTIVETDGAELFSPSPSKLADGRQRGPTWDKHPITRLPLDKWEISEPDGGPAIVRRMAVSSEVGS